jgi:phosphoglycolate phosphatase
LTRPLFIAFDLDGTLIDTKEKISQAISFTRSEFRLRETNKQALDSWFGLHPGVFFEELSNTDELKEAISLFGFQLRRLHDGQVRLFDDTIPTPSHLNQLGETLVIATTKPTDLALDLLANSPIMKFVQTVQGTDDFNPKPDPELFLRLNKEFVKETNFMKISVGDRKEDAIAARGAVYQAVAIRRNDSDPSETEFKKSGASYVIGNLMEIVELAGIK